MFLRLILSLLLVGMPAGGWFGVIQLDEDHVNERAETTTKQSAGERFEQRPSKLVQARELPRALPAISSGFRPKMHGRTAELARLGAAERRML